MKFQIVKSKHPLSVHAVWTVIIIGALVYTFWSTPKACAFHALTGRPCLTCGMTRATAALFSGDFGTALYFNPAGVLFTAALFFFSLFKLFEYIFRFELKVFLTRKLALTARLTVVFILAANWLFLIVTGR